MYKFTSEDTTDIYYPETISDLENINKPMLCFFQLKKPYTPNNCEIMGIIVNNIIINLYDGSITQFNQCMTICTTSEWYTIVDNVSDYDQQETEHMFNLEDTTQTYYIKDFNRLRCNQPTLCFCYSKNDNECVMGILLNDKIIDLCYGCERHLTEYVKICVSDKWHIIGDNICEY